jgi:hypothetical protein
MTRKNMGMILLASCYHNVHMLVALPFVTFEHRICCTHWSV